MIMKKNVIFDFTYHLLVFVIPTIFFTIIYGWGTETMANMMYAFLYYSLICFVVDLFIIFIFYKYFIDYKNSKLAKLFLGVDLLLLYLLIILFEYDSIIYSFIEDYRRQGIIAILQLLSTFILFIPNTISFCICYLIFKYILLFR
jgi:hypothetical protein